MSFYDLTGTPQFRQVVKSAAAKALEKYEDEEQAWEATSYATHLVREAHPAGSQALHMMDHNTGVLASLVGSAVRNEAEARGSW